MRNRAAADGLRQTPAGEVPDFSSSLPMSMLRAREAVMQHFRPILRDQDVTEQQWRVLRALADQGEMEILALARATFLRAPSLSRIIPILERRDLVKRQPVAHDLRRTAVAIRPEGRALLRRLWPRAEAVYAEITELVGAERLQLLFELNRELERTLTKPDEPGDGEET